MSWSGVARLASANDFFIEEARELLITELLDKLFGL